MKNRGLHVYHLPINVSLLQHPTPTPVLIFPGSGTIDQMCPRRAYFLTWGGKPEPAATCDYGVPVQYDTIQDLYCWYRYQYNNTMYAKFPSATKLSSHRRSPISRMPTLSHYNHGSTMPTLSHYQGSTMPTLSHYDHGSSHSLSPHCWTDDLVTQSRSCKRHS